MDGDRGVDDDGGVDADGRGSFQWLLTTIPQM
ncbi:MAG: hypothetical protein AVDCRST_MAG40-3237 [uncultured Gemmatimonadaceae bacterium]|uniref:Uncharacterized protein n=1 Tax=uncultured Gemmatimonadaceae bacterium TaxID=246130 RepID=A0A6J4ME29_9BACT|nr:MAG: hypothetical protein AVDCRST_MAG40-3237 [uncultured Gemmatimonadaceae bacterium]